MCWGLGQPRALGFTSRGEGTWSGLQGPTSFSRGSQWFSGVRGWSRWARSQNAAAELPPEQRYR